MTDTTVTHSYEIVQEEHSANLSRVVELMLADGWCCEGPAQPLCHSNNFGSKTSWSQTLTRVWNVGENKQTQYDYYSSWENKKGNANE